MSQETGERAILRAVNSINKGGILELGFFGGEPFLVPNIISSLIEFSRKRTKEYEINLTIPISTNGTILNDYVWSIINEPEIHLSVSLDGSPENHNCNRFLPDGKGSFNTILKNINSLLEQNINFGVVTVVNPETAGHLKDEIEYLYNLGISHIELSLNIWSSWDSESLELLHQSISNCAELWIEKLPDHTLSWFDDKAAQLTNSMIKPVTCGFGKGDVTVTPSGHLYPCERLVGDDSLNNPMRLDGDVFSGDNFLFGASSDLRYTMECKECGIKDMCNTACGCCNYVRTGKIGQPDKLLCLFNQWTLIETKRVLEYKLT